MKQKGISFERWRAKLACGLHTDNITRRGKVVVHAVQVYPRERVRVASPRTSTKVFVSKQNSTKVGVFRSQSWRKLPEVLAAHFTRYTLTFYTCTSSWPNHPQHGCSRSGLGKLVWLAGSQANVAVHNYLDFSVIVLKQVASQSYRCNPQLLKKSVSMLFEIVKHI